MIYCIKLNAILKIYYTFVKGNNCIVVNSKIQSNYYVYKLKTH